MAIENAFWDEVVTNCSYATFFHTRRWLDILTKTFPSFENVTIGWHLEDGRKALLPLIRTRTGPAGMLYGYHSMWPGVYGGIVSDSMLSCEDLERMYLSIKYTRMAEGYIFGNPLAKELPSHIWKSETAITHMVDLRNGLDSVWKRAESSFRRRVRRAREQGVAVVSASSATDYEEYYEVYKDSQRRWGSRTTSSYPWELFASVCAVALEQPESIRLWLAHVNGRVGAGALVFYHARHAISWHAATLETAFHLSPANALQMAIIEDAIKRGFDWYDLNPSGGHLGSLQFKEAMGAAAWPFTTIRLRPSVIGSVCGAVAATRNSLSRISRVTGARFGCILGG